MSHDPLCPDVYMQLSKDGCFYCDLIEDVRANEKAKWTHVCPDNNCCNGGPN